jgi:hypothetical protein
MWLTFKNSYFQVSSNLSSESTGFQKPWTVLQRAQPDLSGLWPDSRVTLPDSRGHHRTCLVDRTCPISDRLPEALHRTPERFTGLVWWLHQTCPMENLPTALFEVGAINRPPPTPLGRWPLRKQSTHLRSKAWAHSSLSLRLHSSFFIFDRRFKLPWVCHLQARPPHPLPRWPHCICYS